MGFLDKLLGKAKQTAGDVADKTAPMVEKAQHAAGQAWDKAKDRGGDAKDTAADTADEATDTVSDAASDTRDASTGSGPPAA